ncbi:hypothetical protein [Microbacterium sp. 1.5R]|nr:hypothetical protein [Microbacterium sp. 1.5R]
MTPDEATDLFMKLAEQQRYVDAKQLDRDAILAHFTEIFAR